MKFKILFQPEAKAEFFAAISWYENQAAGLGHEFAREALKCIEVAQLAPERFRPVRGRARCIRLKRFKAYSIYFATKGDVFAVISIFHGARNPDDLRKRLP